MSMGRALTEKTVMRTREAFLKALSSGHTITKAAELAGISRAALYVWRDAEDEAGKAFAAEWEQALEEGIDRLEDEARRRAVDGVDKPVVAMGKIARNDDGTVLMIREYSDTLLALMLRAKKPAQYRDRIDANVNLKGGLTVNIEGPDADL
jgi:transposase